MEEAGIQFMQVCRKDTLVLLQTIPGIDIMGAAMLLVEISAEMQNFGSAERLASRPKRPRSW